MGYIWTSKLLVATVAAFALLNSMNAHPAGSTPGKTEIQATRAVTYNFTTYFSAFEQVDKGKEDNKVEIHVCKDDKVVDTPKYDKGFVDKLKQLGSGQTKNGKWYNVVKPASKEYPNGCYAAVDFALGDSGKPLTVYTSAAIKGVKLGTHVEIRELKGLPVNSEQKHNGCVQVTGNYANEGTINLWVYSAAQQKEYFSEIPSTVTMTSDSGCKLEAYTYSEERSKTADKR
ncbi:hypothetical protein IWQ62_005519 [Dispira parvispora]|uniref:Uncharacterized protein n=1 Tax=Dispira parvispora TaxID=1520584 RepID=A0A9W8DZK1_9FUNG|nr:hypothetical protein IWQ62_005519 [Dispira parvispora]